MISLFLGYTHTGMELGSGLGICRVFLFSQRFPSVGHNGALKRKPSISWKTQEGQPLFKVQKPQLKMTWLGPS